MKFKDKYPDMISTSDIVCGFDIDGIILGKDESKCHMCDDKTKYVEINYGAKFCSEECVNTMDDEYARWFDQDPGELE